MAEAVVDSEKTTKDKANNLECAVCLQHCIHPAQLPCGHIFCYLCVKGFANQNKRCAMCRQEIPRDFVDQPQLLQDVELSDSLEGFDGGYQWFYEGRNGWWKYEHRTAEEIESAFKLDIPLINIIICGVAYIIDFQNLVQYPKSHPNRKRSIRRDKIQNLNVKGWWQYDERTSKELENSYKNGEKCVELLIAGFLYVVDFENMLQLRRNDPSRRRLIKRDFSSIPKKGIAGIRTEVSLGTQTVQELPEIRPVSPTEGNVDNGIPVTPSNTPQTPISGRESPNQERDLQATVERISNLRLDSDRNDLADTASEEHRTDSESESERVPNPFRNGSGIGTHSRKDYQH